jgi:pimeloyl-ACP methyl ester carboxylesterase
VRTSHQIKSTEETTVAVHHIERASLSPAGPAILLLHGARASSIPSFDLPIEGGSFARELSNIGCDVFLLDLRNYGDSWRSAALDEPPEKNCPLTRTSDAVEDIRAVVTFILQEYGARDISLMGWATGGQWMTHFAATHPEHISHLILFNALWPVAGPWAIGDSLEDPEAPQQLRHGALRAYTLADKDSLLGRWNTSIPDGEFDRWRDPAVAELYADTAIASDPRSREYSPPRLRVPTGAMADSFLLSRGHRPFDPGAITARTIIIRSELDFWSRPTDLTAAAHELKSARHVQTLQLDNATHFAHLDRPQRGRTRMLHAIGEAMLG